MTAPAEPVDLAQVEQDLAAVLIGHGITGDTVRFAVYPIVQAGETVGVSVTGMAYTAPPGVPVPAPAPDRSPLAEMADRLEAMS